LFVLHVVHCPGEHIDERIAQVGIQGTDREDNARPCEVGSQIGV